ncbi:sugar transferase [Enterovibrio makurazakiensis]|uniref:Sugar transferase n=1 Tax=Enterovibrio gelatinilyticus TaxID=2899819 RepID=A0ABT5R315_9GAMM|nr:sugar transferase [Enterovibrio sp. ZSDZ42]MDD1794661.1 sugar transferase [Enterovibrio sp. ZSDZ42]
MNISMNLNVNSDISPVTAKAKRGFDILFSLIGLALTLPLFPLIALAIKLDSRGPVFFSQMRIGRALPDKSLLFPMIKFRTMRTDAESVTGATWATKTDPRVTRVGRFLRKTRLDEIPQFINVLVGDMSIIGPRPERPGFYQKLENAIPYFAERTYGVTPGITGLAQVNQGYDTCIDDVRSKVGFDHSYALSLTSPTSWLKMDLHIMIRTIVVMVCGRGQ